MNYRWVILALGVLVSGAAIGFGRFSYGILLPSMQAGLQLGHEQTGLVASANMLGYFLAALVAGVLASRYSSRVIISVSLLWTGLAMAATGLAGGMATLVLFRFFTGLGSAGSNIPVMGLSARWFPVEKRGMANGAMVGGAGLAIMAAGWLVPVLNGAYPESGWRYAWWLLALFMAVSAVVAALFLRDYPESTAVPGQNSPNPAPGEGTGVREMLSSPALRLTALTYFCFGVSQIIYTMFFVNYLENELGIDPAVAGGIWSLVGFLSIGSAVVWGSISDKTGRSPAMFLVLALQSLSFTMAATARTETFIYLSAVCFGLTAWAIPGLMASCCGDLVGPRSAAAALGIITLFFGVGQILGPAVAGYIRELSGSFSGAFYLAALAALSGGFIALAAGKKRAPLQEVKL